jgi:putative addiction module component (TIGR02574 family)
MSTQLAELEQKASQLSAEERARFALSLIESLEPTEDDAVEEAWRVEAERRWSEIQSGEAKLIPGDEVFAKVRSRLR